MGNDAINPTRPSAIGASSRNASGAGIGNVTGIPPTVVDRFPRWNNTGATEIKDSPVGSDDDGNTDGILGLSNTGGRLRGAVGGVGGVNPLVIPDWNVNSSLNVEFISAAPSAGNPRGFTLPPLADNPGRVIEIADGGGSFPDETITIGGDGGTEEIRGGWLPSGSTSVRLCRAYGRIVFQANSLGYWQILNDVEEYGDPAVAVAADYTVQPEDIAIFVAAPGGAGTNTVTLPEPGDNKGREITIEAINISPTSNVEVTVAGGFTVETPWGYMTPETSFIMRAAGEGVRVRSDGSVWRLAGIGRANYRTLNGAGETIYPDDDFVAYNIPAADSTAIFPLDPADGWAFTICINGAAASNPLNLNGNGQNLENPWRPGDFVASAYMGDGNQIGFTLRYQFFQNAWRIVARQNPKKVVQGKAADYDVLPGDRYIDCSPGGSDMTVTLPDPSDWEGRRITVKFLASGGGNVIIATAAGDIEEHANPTTYAATDDLDSATDLGAAVTWYSDGASHWRCESFFS